MKFNTKDYISESTIYEVNFDLWGFSSGWIETIIDKIMDFAIEGPEDHCESSTCEANMSVRFQSTNVYRKNKAIRIFNQYAALASKLPKRQGYIVG